MRRLSQRHGSRRAGNDREANQGQGRDEESRALSKKAFESHLARKRERHEEFYLEPDEGCGVVVWMWDTERNGWKAMTLSQFVALAQDVAESRQLEDAQDESMD
jgi:hypothetical protein